MKEKLDLLLVNPSDRAKAYGSLGVSVAGLNPPVDIGLLAAFVRKHGYTVKIIDADAENFSPDETVEKIIEYDPILTSISVGNLNSGDVVKVGAAEKILTTLKKKAPQIKTILEGPYPSTFPEHALKHESVDFVCQGETFYPILGLLETLKSSPQNKNYKVNGICYLKNGAVISNLRAPLIENLDELPFTAWDLLPMDKYRDYHWHCLGNIDDRQHYAALYTSFGCPFNCKFCSVNAVYGKSNYRTRSPENIIKEIDFLVKNYKIKNLRILDNTFTVGHDRVMKICDLIIKNNYKLNMWCYARVETVDEPLLEKMKEAGMNWVAYGIESGSKGIREDVSRKMNLDMMKRAIEITKKIGINIVGNFIFGLPGDSLKTMRESLDLAKEFNFEWANFYVAMAYPGSELYDYALKNGIKLPENWSGYGQYSEDALPMSTEYLSAAEVLRFRDNAFYEYYTNPKYLKLIKNKFGQESVDYIKGILDHKIKRKYA
ncbi:MAG: radical SAM protein [Candidatus Paceibacterota bacterium]